MSWYLPKPTNMEFTVSNTRSGKPILSGANYNNVMSLESRITFTGSISPSGTGLFRFVISDVKFHDECQFECYAGPPDNRGFTIDNCGQNLIVMAASTVYIRFGETASLAWNLHGSGMKEFWVRNDFWKSTIFHITKYKQVNIPIRTLRSRIVFTGNITSTGTGLFRFMINDADDHDFGQYSCYKGSPQRPGAKVPNCGQNLVVIRVQEPYIESPGKATVGDSVNLTCHSFFKSYPIWNLTMSFIWSRNGTRVEHGGKHKLESVSRRWTGGQYMTSTLTISGVTKKDRGERYTCQTVVGENLLKDQSVDNVLGVSYIPDPHSTNTEVEVGDNVLFSMKTSVHQTKIYLIGPTDKLVFEMDSTKIYIREAYWTRIKVMKVITLLDTVSLQFQLSDITSSDAGRYYCSLKPRGLTGCYWEHFLAIFNITQTSAATTTGVPLPTATTANTDQSVTTVVLYIIVGCCVLFIVLTVFIVAAIVLIRIKQQGVHQRRTPSTSTTSNIVQRQRYDVVECSPVGGAENSQLYAENSLGYHTLNFKRFNRLNEVDPTDANTTRNRLVPLDQDYEPVTLMDHGPVLDCTQQYSDHEEENNDSVSLCSSYDNGRSGYARCIVVAGNVPTISFE